VDAKALSPSTSLTLNSQLPDDGRPIAQKAGMAERLLAFNHIGLLFNEPLGQPRLLFISSSDNGYWIFNLLSEPAVIARQPFQPDDCLAPAANSKCKYRGRLIF
jgi:hypothetical protein